MPLTKKQVSELKKQLSEQIQNLPEEQRKKAQEQIDKMSDQAIELMLNQQQAQQTQQIFRSIVEGKIPSKKIAENDDATAVLDIKPISKGHVIIIPKNKVTNTKDLPKTTIELANIISSKIKKELKSKEEKIIPQSSFGEIIINVIPIYDKDLNIDSERYEAPKAELEELEKALYIPKEKKIETIKIQKKKEQKPIILKRRIP